MITLFVLNAIYSFYGVRHMIKTGNWFSDGREVTFKLVSFSVSMMITAAFTAAHTIQFIVKYLP